jgi:hypothetical protein
LPCSPLREKSRDSDHPHFSGKFGSKEKACQYSEQQWERPAPDDSWPEEDYAAWEGRNPIWLLRRDLATPLDPDFVETIFGSHMIDYPGSQLANEVDKQKVLAEIPQEADTLALIMSAAFDCRRPQLSSLQGCGTVASMCGSQVHE